MASKMVYNTVKGKLGLDEARYLIYGAAQLTPAVRNYFLTLNMFLLNSYGMSESSGPITIHYPRDNSEFNIRSCGAPFGGAEIKIYKPDKDGTGEICIRGRNVFMGYFKDDK